MILIDAKTHPYCARAQGYVEGVLDGSIPNNELIKRACERHQRDIERIGTPDWPYTYDLDKAERKVRFNTRFPHVKGKWSDKHELFDPQPWQCFWDCSLFGWIIAETGLRRFRRARGYVPRKQGKSFLAAPTGLYMLTADGEAGAEVYSGATSEKQAWEIFGPAKQMALKRPDFLERFGVQVNAKGLSVPGSMAKFEPIIGKPGDGSSPHCSLIDEYHEHLTDELLATMETGMGAREQPLSIVVSTAGDNMAGPCRADWLECMSVLNGTSTDEQLFALIFTCDKDDDWTSEAALRKANPNYGVSVSAEFLLGVQRNAINNPRKQGRFKTKHLNIWVQARDGFMDLLKWRAATDITLKIEQFKHMECYVGMDLATKIDLCSVVFLFPQPGGYFTVFTMNYLPRATVDLPQNEHYREWEASGLLTVTDGNITDYDVIEEDLKQAAKDFNVVDMGYDPHNATMLATHLMTDGIPLVEFGQTPLNMNEPMRQIEALVLDKKIRHNDDKVMEWAMSNVIAKETRNGNMQPTKETNEKKIDPFVGLCIAMGRYMAGGPRMDFDEFCNNPIMVGL